MSIDHFLHENESYKYGNEEVGDDKLRRKVVSFLLVTLMMATITPVHADEVSEPTTAATEVTTTETKPTTIEKKETTHHKEKKQD